MVSRRRCADLAAFPMPSVGPNARVGIHEDSPPNVTDFFIEHGEIL